MGDIGKTTLAKKVYNCEEVKRHFDCRAWAYVSQDYGVKDVFKRLIKEVKPNLSTEELQEMEMFSEVYLEEKLRELLKDRTYLVVLDDIWDLEAWESLNRAFPDANKKGRVILATRNKKVAKESVVIHQLQTLNQTESWELFIAKAFGNDGCPANLEESGKEMVQKCDGLPLAITILAGLLRGKSPQEWFTVRDRIVQQQLMMKVEGKTNIEKIMSLSYNALPYQLKACYLYIGLFPEDYEIEAEVLIRLWIAEGFIRCERDDTLLEDVASAYLDELIDRNMLQVARKDDLGNVCSCRIHDLLREFYISKGRGENFLDYYARSASCPSSSSSSNTTMASSSSVCISRRYAIHSGIGRYDFSNNLSNSHLRTLLLFNRNRGESLQQQQLESISNIRLLRVLDLSNVDLSSSMNRLPDAFGKLIRLRYLRLCYTHAKLPSSIERLQSLQTLDLGWSPTSHWSDIAIGALSKLTQLRHLFLSVSYWNGLDREVVNNLPRIDTLTNLQTLRSVNALVWKQNEITNLINLRDLEIFGIETSDVGWLLLSIAKLNKIQSLQLQLSNNESTEKYGFPTLVPLSYCHHLRDLILWGKIERLPRKSVP
ncbi:putative disease resistance RPP13-like protein 3 [Telopea speciosissima]|uniref:putative disease resistance RPP13-like protein 3 n=1 Tax=Telopea speciosissima TaxID=54955 RepID=UPI001CC4EB68|nr:putative disease resistance RPP13-like protein 3 [Telopea speciosissima]